MAVMIATPIASARGTVRAGSRASPASLGISHQPPNAKNAPTSPAANAIGSGSEPARCATKGTKFDQLPACSANARNAERVADVARESRRECCCDAGVHDEQAFPAIEKSDRGTIGFAQVHVAAARLGRSCRELAITQCAAQRHRTHDEPNDQQPKR